MKAGTRVPNGNESSASDDEPHNHHIMMMSSLSCGSKEIQGGGRLSLLAGVVVCLSGLQPEKKEFYHSLVEQLGGRYSRDLNVNSTTHLVATQAEGPKYQAASSRHSSIEIVSPSWLHACRDQKRRVDESLHRVKKKASADKALQHRPKRAKSQSKLQQALEEQLDDNQHSSAEGGTSTSTTTAIARDLFAACQFVLVGFHDDFLLGRLIRRGMGTIHWIGNARRLWPDPGAITHVIVAEESDTKVPNEVLDFMLTAGVQKFDIVNAWWVVASWKAGVLQESAKYAAAIDHAAAKPEETRAQKASAKAESLPAGILDKPQQQPSQQVPAESADLRGGEAASRQQPVDRHLFRGCFFCLVRVAPPSWAVDFDSDELESLIKSSGGRLLTTAMIDALKADADQAFVQRRKCFVVCWGGSGADNKFRQLHPLLSQVQRHQLCDMTDVTPIWLKTCCKESTVLEPDKLPDTFVPTSRPMARFPTVNDENSEKPAAAVNCCCTVTALTGWQRTAAIEVILAMEASYNESLVKGQTTHLIVPSAWRQEDGTMLPPPNRKYEMATKWKLQIRTLRELVLAMDGASR